MFDQTPWRIRNLRQCLSPRPIKVIRFFQKMPEWNIVKLDCAVHNLVHVVAKLRLINQLTLARQVYNKTPTWRKTDIQSRIYVIETLTPPTQVPASLPLPHRCIATSQLSYIQISYCSIKHPAALSGNRGVRYLIYFRSALMPQLR